MLPESLSFLDPRTRDKYSGEDLRFEASVGTDPKTSQVFVESLQYTLGSEDHRDLRVGMAPAKQGYKLTPHGYKLVRTQGRAWQPPPPVRFYGFPDEVFSYYQNADFLASFTLSLERQFRGLQYLGPLRNRAKRAYSGLARCRSTSAGRASARWRLFLRRRTVRSVGDSRSAHCASRPLSQPG